MQLSFCMKPFCVFDSLCCMPIKQQKTFQLYFFFFLGLNFQVNVLEPHTCEAMRWDNLLSTFRCDLLERWKTQIALAGYDEFGFSFFFLLHFCFSQMGLKFCLALNHGAQALGAWRMTRRHLPFIIVEAYFLQACIGDIHPGAEESSLKLSSRFRA